MSRIYADELVNLNGTGYVTASEGLKVSPTKTLDLSGAKINLTAGLGSPGQVLSTTGAGLNWVNNTDSDTTYTFAAQGLSVNNVRLNLTAGGSGSGTQSVNLTGSGSASITYNAGANVIDVSATNTTYSISALDGTVGKQIIRLTGSNSVTDDVTLVAGSNITLTRANDEITISTSLSGTVGGPVSSTNNAVVLFNGTDGTLVKNSPVTISTTGSITAPSGSSSVIPFYYPSQSDFPSPATYRGAVAYSENGNDLFYAAGSQWIELAKLSDISPDTNTTYSVSLVDTSTTKKTIRLSDSNGITDDIGIVAGTGISLTKTGEDITISNALNIKTYNVSAETASGNAVNLRLSDNSSPVITDDVRIAGADGILLYRTDANTIIIGTTLSGLTQYTDAQAKTAAAQALINGTSAGIDFTYNSFTQTIDCVVTASGAVGGGGVGILYDFYGTNTTSNNVILNLDPSEGVNDTVEFVGAGGTTVSWDAINQRATIQSTAPVNADWNATSGLAQILNKPSIPPAYVLPTATTSVLGGVRVDGTTITVTASGVLSASPGGYSLPASTPTTLGGIKIGAGLDIDGNGVVNVTASGVGGGLVTRQALSGETSSLAADETAELNIVGYKTYTLLKIATSAESWVRVYTDDASRVADSTRSEGQDPVAGSGVIAEVRTSGAQTVLLTPGVIGFNNDTTPNTNIYLSVTNRSGTTTPITVTLTAIRLEA